MRISDWSSDVCSSDLQRRDAPADPVGQRGEADLDALPREDLRLTVKRKVIAVFVAAHLRDQCLGWQDAGHYMCRCRRMVEALGVAKSQAPRVGKEWGRQSNHRGSHTPVNNNRK